MQTRIPVDEMPTPQRVIVDERLYDLWSDGTLLRVIRGGIDDGGEPAGGGEPSDSGGGSNNAQGSDSSQSTSQGQKSFTQEDYDRGVQERLRKERESQSRKLQEQLGGRSLDDVLKAAQEHDALIESNKSEMQKALDAANKKAADAEQLAGKARTAELRANAVTALVMSGVDPKRLQRASETLVRDLDKLDKLEDDSIEKTIETLKAELPEWFGVPQQQSKPPASDVNGRGPASGGGDEGSGVDAGRARARKERENNPQNGTKMFEGLRALGEVSA